MKGELVPETVEQGTLLIARGPYIANPLRDLRQPSNIEEALVNTGK
jgi:hypothetical protein